MKTAALISADECLRTTYDPNRDYVDGEVIERSVGERDHSVLQRELVFYFRLRRREWNVHVFVEQRVQVSKTRYRIPDICAYAGENPKDRIFPTPPFICIEIASTITSASASRLGRQSRQPPRPGLHLRGQPRNQGRHPYNRGPTLTVDLAEIFSELDT